MSEYLKESVLKLHKIGDWEKILELNQNSDEVEAQNLLWVWPSVDNLKFITNYLLKYDLKGIVSLGCGCGLLEWIIEKYSALQVVGYEVNKEWWKSKYSNPQFIELFYPVLPLEENIDGKFALLFCYFNNESAFVHYINRYEGKVIIIIGPGKGRGRHTNPEPFSPNLNSDWNLKDFQEVRNTKDFVAIYEKI